VVPARVAVEKTGGFTMISEDQKRCCLDNLLEAGQDLGVPNRESSISHWKSLTRDKYFGDELRLVFGHAFLSNPFNIELIGGVLMSSCIGDFDKVRINASVEVADPTLLGQMPLLCPKYANWTPQEGFSDDHNGCALVRQYWIVEENHGVYLPPQNPAIFFRGEKLDCTEYDTLSQLLARVKWDNISITKKFAVRATLAHFKWNASVQMDLKVIKLR